MGTPVVSCIFCYYCATNASVYNIFGGLGKVFMEASDTFISYLITSISLRGKKHNRNNINTVFKKELCFMAGHIVFTAHRTESV